MSDSSQKEGFIILPLKEFVTLEPGSSSSRESRIRSEIEEMANHGFVRCVDDDISIPAIEADRHPSFSEVCDELDFVPVDLPWNQLILAESSGHAFKKRNTLHRLYCFEDFGFVSIVEMCVSSQTITVIKETVNSDIMGRPGVLVVKASPSRSSVIVSWFDDPIHYSVRAWSESADWRKLRARILSLADYVTSLRKND